VNAYRYTAQTGDVRYALPSGGWWGAVFSRGADPGGARLPLQVLLRNGRVFPLYDAAAYGFSNVAYATEEPITSRGGSSEVDFCYFVGAAFREYEDTLGVSVLAPPTTLAAGASTWGWTLVT